MKLSNIQAEQLSIAIQQSLDHTEAICKESPTSNAHFIFVSHLLSTFDAANVYSAIRIMLRLQSLDMKS